MYLLASYCAEPGFISDVVAPMVATGAMLMVLLVAVIYMAAQFFRKNEYEAWANLELYQILVSVLIFMFVFGSTCLAAEISDRMSPGGDMFKTGRDYLYYVSNDIALEAVKDLQYAMLFSQYIGSWTMRWGASAWGTVVPAFPSFILIERVVDFLLLLVTPFSSSLMVQQVMLEIIRGTMLPFVLPAGVVLRLFPPTREAAAFLISVSMGFGIIFPFTYVMHNDIVRPMATSVLRGAPQGLEQTLQRDGLNLILTNINPLSDSYDTYSWIFRPLLYFSFLLLQALFLPALSITLTVAFIKGMTKFISQKLS